ncbi:cobalamin-binding protein [Thiomicrorhabdus cannonii]|uniref:cobalamin-binding protein n=1 Tax=Thiomicrorhabdus cannonii TaxID=2748011 RepID=UPI0015C1A0F8|nr:cobalamin-binding protein [Thiomicrorhabdus cannonii]
MTPWLGRLWLLFAVLTISVQMAQAAPVQRIVSLAPHLTEMLYSAGAGDKLVGVVNYSDYPQAALKLPQVGSYNAINLEAIIALQPDLILTWRSGNRVQDKERLQSLGLTVFESEVENLEDISDLIAKLGELAGTQEIAQPKAAALRAELQSLREHYQQKTPVSVFYQIWNKPFITMNGRQFISQGLDVCGAHNIFADLPTLTAQVNLETIISRNPQVILLGGQQHFQHSWLADWQAMPQVTAIQNRQIHRLNNNLYQRPTERFIHALTPLCELLDNARQAYGTSN